MFCLFERKMITTELPITITRVNKFLDSNTEPETITKKYDNLKILQQQKTLQENKISQLIYRIRNLYKSKQISRLKYRSRNHYKNIRQLKDITVAAIITRRKENLKINSSRSHYKHWRKTRQFSCHLETSQRIVKHWTN